MNKAMRIVFPGIVMLSAASAVLAQAGGGGGSGTNPTPAKGLLPSPEVVVRNPHRATLMKMQRVMSLNVKETRLEDVIKFIQGVTQAEIEVAWLGDGAQTGLDKEKLVTLNIANRPALNVLETVLAKVKADFGENTWQMTSEGAIEIGPKEILNKSKRLVIYDIHDLLMEIPNYPDVPQIDLTSVLQQGQGGNGQSPFTTNNQNQAKTPDQVRMEREAKTRQLTDIIQSTIESEQWVDNGGEGGTIRPFNNTLIINAPDYMHRQINGYPYWPSATRTTANGRRYLTLNMDSSLGKVDGFAQQPVTGVTGGGGGGGGGGQPGGGPGGP